MSDDHAMIEALWPILYGCGYARLGVGESPSQGTNAPDAAFRDRLAEHNSSRPRWDSGWKVYEVANDGVLHVQKGDCHRPVVPGEFLSESAPGVPLVVGGTVALMVAAECRVRQPGFYFIFGEEVASRFDDVDLARFYFNAPAALAPELVEGISYALNRRQIPFRMKCLTQPEGYDRADPAVLYVARRFVPATLRCLASLESVLSRLDDGVPLFSKEIFRGVGGADDPGTGESFGMSRCRLVATGMLAAHRASERGIERRLAHVADAFRSVGLSLSASHLRPHLIDVYFWPENVA